MQFGHEFVCKVTHAAIMAERKPTSLLENLSPPLETSVVLPLHHTLPATRE